MKQVLEFIPNFSRRQLAFALCAAAMGILAFIAVRLVFQPDTSVHYHANFAVFVNGQRQEFKGPQYYQEVAICSDKTRPQARVHMHDAINHVVHVHDKLVTWANFFDVLGWSLQEKALFDGTKSYSDGQDGRLRFILNGKPVLSIANEVIKSEDRLLISFGNEDTSVLQTEYTQVEADARQFNQRNDPASCTGPEEESGWQRLQRAVWF